ncbi:ARM repeat-containing protein [Ascodesmis nigricans]|uniref:ARM repeat-containing protein n=1 Tax=Ascodesmis nigricans TaxID=341454 RepID=A0A4S2MS78_9PEZI|nr:ARM repeat-containing protein [Ascodesmis nigricans]
MASWQPQETALRELATYLGASLSKDQAAQKQATQMLQEATQNSPDIVNYLCHILVNPAAPMAGVKPDDYMVVRCSAAMLLKNTIQRVPQALNQTTIDYIKPRLLVALGDEAQSIRNFTSNVINELLKKGGIMSWSDVLGELLAMVDGANSQGAPVSIPAQEAAMSTLKKVCEDSKKGLIQDPQQPLTFLIPKFLHFTQHQSPKVQTNALESINVFLPIQEKAVLANIDGLIESLFRLGNNPHSPLRQEVCRALVHLVDIQPEKLAGIMSSVVDYLLEQQRDKDNELALDAAEFWLTVGEHEELKGHLGPFLPKIVPVLLKSMVYADEDIVRLSGEVDDAEEEDRAEDLKPTFAKSRGRNSQGLELTEEQIKASALEEGEISDSDDDLDSEYDEMFGDSEERWNLRKCSAAALDVLATVFGQEVLNIILPYLKDSLRSDEWWTREAAVLALGAVADGCMEGVAPHLPELIPFLLGLLSDPEAVVRQITCWTLGRYARWAAFSPNPAHQQTYFVPLMEGILRRMLDRNKRVQEAAASAFANLEEQCKKVLTPYIEPIVQQFVRAMQTYKDRNMFILYDCIQTLAEHVQDALAADNLVNILMPALIQRWKKVHDESRELFPLLECLSYVATALGEKFMPYAQPVFYRCTNIIHKNLEYQAQHNQNPEIEEPEKDFLVTSLDLLSAIIQALNHKSAELVANTQPPFFQLLTMCMNDTDYDVRQSAYALLGDCAIYVFPHLQPYIPAIMDLLLNQLDVNFLNTARNDSLDSCFAVINNACWSCGEIALKHGTAMAPYITNLYTNLFSILSSTKVPHSVTENAAVALGRLGLGSCDELAPHLREFAHPFLEALSNVIETDEKDTAFSGFCMVVGRNPEAMEGCLVELFRGIAKYEEPSEGLRRLFRQTVEGYRSFIADFQAFITQIPPQERQAIERLINSP